MAYAQFQVKTKIFAPAAVGASETTAVFSVKAGTRVWAASARVLVAASASTDSTISLGDGTSAAGYIAAYDTETNAAGTIVPGAGALFNQSGGKIYTVDDTVDAVYAFGTSTGTVPRVLFTIVVTREYPGPGPA